MISIVCGESNNQPFQLGDWIPQWVYFFKF